MVTASLRIDKNLFDKAATIGKALSRTAPKQIEHWAKIGQLMEENPKLSYKMVKSALLINASKGSTDPWGHFFDEPGLTEFMEEGRK